MEAQRGPRGDAGPRPHPFLLLTRHGESFSLFIQAGGGKKLISAENEFSIFSSSRHQSRGRTAQASAC